MSTLVGPLAYIGVGGILLSWAFEAHRRWVDCLAKLNEIPMGASELLETGWFRPRKTARGLLEVGRASYPRARETDDYECEKWRVRRKRRIALGLLWMVIGGPIAILVVIALDAADSAWWLLTLILVFPVAALAVRVAHRFGNFEPGSGTGLTT
jgi:hypothetical protein